MYEYSGGVIIILEEEELQAESCEKSQQHALRIRLLAAERRAERRTV